MVPNERDGFTIIEMIVTITIIAIAIIPLTAVLTKGIHSNRSITAREKAIIVAQSAMDEFLARPQIMEMDSIFRATDKEDDLFVKTIISDSCGLKRIIISVHSESEICPIATVKSIKFNF